MSVSGIVTNGIGSWGSIPEVVTMGFSVSADATAPTVTLTTIVTAGTSVTLTMSENVTFGAGGNTGFVLTPSGGASTMTYSSGDGTSSLVYTLSRTIDYDETLTLAYTQPGNGVEDTTGNDLVTFSGASVTNNSTVNQPPATGSTLQEWIFSQGGTGTYADRWNQYWTTAGVSSGAFNDRMYEWLTDEGYTQQNINDKLAAWKLVNLD